MARYSINAASGSMCSACTTPAGPLLRRPVAIRRSAYGSGSTSNIRAMPWRPSTSQSSTSLPCEASASAREAATVDFPVPPLPVTTCRRTPDQSLLTAETVGGASGAGPHYLACMGARESLVGRAEELGVLTEFLGAAEDDGLVLTGEAGLGKTALWEGALDLATALGTRILVATPGEGEERYSFG